MPDKSRWSLPIPRATLPTFLFGSPDGHIENGDAPALLDADMPNKYYLTYNAYRLWSQRFALGLQKAGLKDGDAVMIFSTNTIFFPVVIMGAIMAGGKFTGANPSYVAREVAHQLFNSEAKFLLCSEASLPVVQEAAQMCKFPKEQIFIFDEGYDTFNETGRGLGGHKHWSTLLAPAAEAAKFRWTELGTREQLNRTICLNYSSGTTGLAKGVEITHINYVSNTVQHMYLNTLRPEYEEKRRRARWLCFLPMYHALAQTVFCAGGPHERIPIYVMKKFDFQRMLENVQNFRITELWMVPPIAVAMAKSPLTQKYDLSSVEGAGCGAAPLGPEVAREFERLWPDGKINLKQGYGMTEVTCSALGWDPREHSDSFSVGEPNPNVEVRLMNDDGTQEVPAGERGEVWIRGPNVMKGYWKNPKATEETLTEDGWLKTGDVAYVDRNGRYFIVDRIKELIKVKGLQVAPAELEALLLEHPAIADAAVIGVTANNAEAPRAYIVKSPGQDVTEKEVKDFIAKRASRHKWLDGGVKFVDAIMKNPSGKILRKKYREEAQKEIEDSSPRARL